MRPATAPASTRPPPPPAPAAAAAPTPALPRRAALAAALAAVAVSPPLPARADAGDWSSPGLATPVDDAAPPFFTAGDLGVKAQDVAAGSGEAARAGDSVTIEYVLRRANGYFIYSTVQGVSFQPADVPAEPFTFVVGSPDVIPGLSSVVTGMRPGGKRRALLPPGAAYGAYPSAEPQPPTFAAKRQVAVHAREPLVFEVALVKVRR